MATTPIPKKYFQLVNIENQLPLNILFGDTNTQTDDWRYCDWDLDGNGHIRTIVEQDALTQSVLKNVFTEKQDNGLGTNIYDLLGEKDIVVKRASLFMDLTMAMVTQKLKADAQSSVQNIAPNDLIKSMSKLAVESDSENPSQINIQMRLLNNADEQIDVGVV